MPEKRVSVPRSLIQAIRELQASAQWTQLPLGLRQRIERGLRNGGQNA